MKKHLTGILAVLLAFCIALVGCGGGGNEGTSPAQEPSQQVEPKDDNKLSPTSGDDKKQEEEDAKKKEEEEAKKKEEEEARKREEEAKKQQEQQNADAAFIGTWGLVAMEGSDNDTSEEDIAAMEAVGLTVDLTYFEDGSVTLTMFGEEYETGTWKAKSATEGTVTMQGQQIDVTIDNSTGRMRFYQGDNAMYFVRRGDAPAPAPNTDEKPAEKPAVEYDQFDSKGNPTLYSVLELSGPDFVAALEGKGFSWNSERKWWVSSDGNDCVYVSGNNEYEYVRTEIASFAANGKGDSCVYVIVVDDRDYSSMQDAFNKLCNIEVLDQQWVDEVGIVAVKGPSGTINLVLINYNDDIGLYIMNVFNEKAISSGLLEEYLGEDCGSTASEVWETLFGRSLG